MSIRGAHYIMDYVGRFLEALFFDPDNETHFDFLIRQPPSNPKLGPACQLSKIEQASQAKLGHWKTSSNINKIYVLQIFMKNCTNHVSDSLALDWKKVFLSGHP